MEYLLLSFSIIADISIINLFVSTLKKKLFQAVNQAC